MFRIFLITTILLLTSISVSAEFIGPGSMWSQTTVSDISTKREDARVSLVGYLVNQIDDEHYTFRDETGQMVVEIHPHELMELTVTTETKIRIIGEVDDGKHDAKVDVDHIEILK